MTVQTQRDAYTLALAQHGVSRGDEVSAPELWINIVNSDILADTSLIGN